MIDWVKVKQNYLTTSDSLEQTADKFKIDRSGVRAHASAEKWVEQKEKIRQEIDKKSTEKTIEKKAESLAEKNLRRAEQWQAMEQLVRLKLREFQQHVLKTNTLWRFQLEDLETLSKILKTSVLGERLEDGQPTAITKGETDIRDKTLEDILGHDFITGKLKEDQRSRVNGTADGTAHQDSGQKKAGSPTPPKPSPKPVPPANDKPKLDSKA